MYANNRNTPEKDRTADGRDADRTSRFARALLALRPTQTDDERLADLLLDHLGVVIGGARLPWVRSVLDWTETYAGTGSAALVDRSHTAAPEVAAFANAVAAHSYELDDTHDTSLSHPGAVIFPVTIAMASQTAANGATVLAAVTAGYEAMARLGESVGAADLIAAGFHPTCVLGPIGAATAAARVMNLDERGLLHAWGHALSLSGGSMQFSQEADGADVKRLHAGYAARAGVLAAEMARNGILAPVRSLDGRYGFLAMFGGNADPAGLTVAPGGTLAIHEVSLKPYACNRLFHSTIDALREVSSFALNPDAVERIVVSGPRKLVDQHSVRRPGTAMAAQYSLPFSIGAAFVHGPEDFSAYDGQNLGSSRILRWADKVEVEIDAEFDALFPVHFGSAVEIHMVDGTTRHARTLDSVGTRRRPMPYSAIEAKARALLSHHNDDDRLAGAIAAVRGLCSAQSTAALQAVIAQPSL